MSTSLRAGPGTLLAGALVAALSVAARSGEVPSLPGAGPGPSDRPVVVGATPGPSEGQAADGETSHRHDPELQPLRARPGAAFRDARTSLVVRLGGETVPYDVHAIQLQPDEAVAIEIEGPGEEISLRYSAGRARPGSSGVRWRWTAPADPGIYALRVESATDAHVHVNVLVAHPATEMVDGELLGYPVGQYRRSPLRGDPAYLPPRGFAAVYARDEDVLASPHFTLGALLCKEPGSPRLLHLSPALVVKLEAILAAVNRAGRPASTLHVMSGFRTPAYNRSIGNRTSYSRHLWGDAADIWVDHDGDGQMDDWNGDGRSDIGDARLLARIVESVERRRPDVARPGGLAVYRRNAAHGPFVHVDARGRLARW